MGSSFLCLLINLFFYSKNVYQVKNKQTQKTKQNKMFLKSLLCQVDTLRAGDKNVRISFAVVSLLVYLCIDLVMEKMEQ